MTLADPALPYGIRDIRLTPINSDGSLGVPVDLPVAQVLTFSEAETFEQLRGDDRLVAIHGKGAIVEWTLEAGGISLEAWALMNGATITDTGSTPTQIKELLKKVTDSRPYFRIEGQAINDVDGDTHVVIYKAKVTDKIDGSFADGTFFLTKCSGQGLGDGTDNLYKMTWNETATAIGGGGINEIQAVIANGTGLGGTYTLTYSGQTTSAIAIAATADTVEAALIALSNIGVAEVNVTGSITAAGGVLYVEFLGTLGESNQPQMTVDVTSLTGTGKAMAIATIRQGALPTS